MTKFFVADVETTGISSTDRIVEVAFVAIDEDFNELSRGYSLIDPEIPIPAGASAVHHITNRMVEEEPTILQYMHLNEFPMKAEDSVLIAHNADFDFRYLGDWMHPDTQVMCTLRLARKLYPDADSHKLQALKYYLDLPEVEGDAHRADADVYMLVNLLRHMSMVSGLSLQGLMELANQPIVVTHWKFGKFKGKRLEEADKGYVKWLLGQDNVDKDLRATLEKMVEP